MTALERFEIAGAGGRVIRGEARLARGSATGIVMCHGFKGFAHFGFFPWLAEQFVSAGFTVVTFDFSGSGVGADRETFTEMEAFAENTIGRELFDVDAVLAESERREWIAAPAGLFGFSRGGGVAVLAAARDAARHRIGALVTWSAISTVFRWSQQEIDDWRARGYADVPNSRTKQVMRVSAALLEEALAEGDTTLDIQGAASRLAIPWLIVHGLADETVPVHEGRQLHTASGGRAELALIERASHGYGSRHGMTEPTPELQAAALRTVRFYRANLPHAHGAA